MGFLKDILKNGQLTGSNLTAEMRHRLGKAWLVSAATFVVTVVVVLGLFYSVRFGWQHLRWDGPDRDMPVAEQPSTEEVKATESAAPTPKPTPQPTPAPDAAILPRTGPDLDL